MLLTRLFLKLRSVSLLTYSRTTYSWTAHPAVRWTLPSQLPITKMPCPLAISQSENGSSSPEVPSSQMTPACIKLTETHKQKSYRPAQHLWGSQNSFLWTPFINRHINKPSKSEANKQLFLLVCFDHSIKGACQSRKDSCLFSYYSDTADKK